MKYFKPKSLTWWASFAPLTAGVFSAALPVHGMVPAVETIEGITGGIEPYMLINAGLMGIGLRGAL